MTSFMCLTKTIGFQELLNLLSHFSSLSYPRDGDCDCHQSPPFSFVRLLRDKYLKMAHFTLHAGNQEEDDQEFEASAAAAMVAVNLLSSARVILKLDKKYTEYSAQYLLEHACPKKEGGEGETDHGCSKLTAKHCIEFVFKQGIPKGEDWPHLGFLLKPPSFYIPALVSMKGELTEPKDNDEALKFFYQQPIGARLHVFSPELDDHVDKNGVYDGPSSDETRYVGLRDVMVIRVNTTVGEKPVATVRMYYNKKETDVDVALDAMILGASSEEPGPLLVDYFLPRLSIN